MKNNRSRPHMDRILISYSKKADTIFWIDGVFTFVDNRVEYQCSECDRRFLTRQACRQHQSLHGDSAAKCEECDKRFVNTGVLKQHIDRIHKGKNAKRAKLALSCHLSIHTKHTWKVEAIFLKLLWNIWWPMPLLPDTFIVLGGHPLLQGKCSLHTDRPKMRNSAVISIVLCLSVCRSALWYISVQV